MAFINTVNWHKLFNMLNAARNSIHIVLPGIDDELAELLVLIKKESPQVSISVCIDNSEESIRNGYGEALGIDKLIQSKIPIKESKGNRIAFFISDNKGYLFFPESRILTAEPTGPNALELDLIVIIRLIAHYFPPVNMIEKEHLMERLKDNSPQLALNLEGINDEIINVIIPVTTEFKIVNFNKTKEALLKNPPISPDLQRRIKTYTTKIQFVELKLSGINFQARTIKIPKDAIPIGNAELKNLLLTKMKLFQNIEGNKSFSVFSDIKKRVEVLRDDYLKPITCREGKSLIELEWKSAFIERLQKIKNEIKNLNKSLPDILEAATMETKDLIKAELLAFYRKNLPDELKQYNDPIIRNRKLIEFVDRIFYSIPFPKPEKLIDKISLNDYYYDLTFQDFSDTQFIDELQKKGIMKDEDIKGIVDMKNAFEEKK